MLVGAQTTPVTWQLPNGPNAVRRLVRNLEREARGPVRVCYEAGPLRVRVAAADDDAAHGAPGHRVGADPSEAR
jgi:hypothetical protein